MHVQNLIRCLVRTFAITLAAGTACFGQSLPPKPNIIFILCDDFGFGDTGPTWQNMRAAGREGRLPAFATPQLDRFADEGTELHNHYTAAPVCAPARASLLLGVHQGHANVRNAQFDKALAENHTIATVLREAGYATAAFGKWGLQGQIGSREEDVAHGNPSVWDGYPTKRGFDYYYGYVRHRDGHYHYPKEDGKQVWENDREVSGELDLSYTTDLFTARAKKWIVDHRKTRAGQPFFVYLAFDTPHAILQYPPSAYPGGGGLTGGVQWTGRPGAMLNTATGTIDGWCHPDMADATWDHDSDPSTPEVAWPDVQKRYATSVRRIDDAVGDLIHLLQDLGIDEETLIVFTSDNGPSAESYIEEPFEPTFFDGFGPFDGIKRDVLEGGVREPTFVRWPGRVPGGRLVRSPSGMWDWMPTFAELAGLPPPAASDGVSLVPTLTGVGGQRPSTIYIEYFHPGSTPKYAEFAPKNRGRMRREMQLLMENGFSGLRYDIQSADDDFEIYDVERDPQQARDLAKDPALAELQRRLKARVLQLRRADASAPRPYDDVLVPPIRPAKVTEGRITCDLYEGEWPWVPDFATLQPVRRQAVPAIDLSACPEGDNMGMAFTGLFKASADGDYTFTVSSDGGAQLFLHDARVVDDDFARTGAPVSGTIRLAAGWHPIRLYYRHATGERRLALEYEGPSIARQPVPAAALALEAE